MAILELQARAGRRPTATAARRGAVVVYVVRPTILKPAPSEKASTWFDLSRGMVRF